MTRRYPHWLQPLSKTTFPRAIICVDCTGTTAPYSKVSKVQTESLSSWSAVGLSHDGSEYRQVRQAAGFDAAEFWRLLGDTLSEPGQVWVLSWRCTRVWSLLALWKELEDGRVRISGWDTRSAAMVSSAVQSVRRGQRDALGPVSAGAMSRMLDAASGLLVCEAPPCILSATVEKTAAQLTWIDSLNFGQDAPDDRKQGIDTALWLAQWIAKVARFVARYKLGSLRTTVAAQAMCGFRTSYYTGGIYVSTEPVATELEQQSYCGGRCECSQIGHVGASVWHIDRRSAYGWHCVCDSLPGRVIGSVRTNVATGAVTGEDCRRSIARVDIATEYPDYPLDRDGLVIYPVGRFTTTLCGPELADAHERGRIARIHTIASYHLKPYLKDYASAIYAGRQHEDSVSDSEGAALAKRLIVALPGKLGQRNRRWETCNDHGIGLQYGSWLGASGNGGVARYRTIAGFTQRDCDDGLGNDSVPAIAAWITSAARMALLKAIRIAGRANVYYCDTDSLMVNKDGLTRLEVAGLVRAGELGYWSVREGPGHVELRGVKHYVFDGSMTCAGLPRGEVVGAGDGSHYWYTPSPTDQIRARHEPQARRELRPYERAEEYRHGIVGDDGRVSPIRLEEW